MTPPVTALAALAAVSLIALGFIICNAWWARLERQTPRRGRHEAAPPELEPETDSATGILDAITAPVQPPLPRRDPPGRPRVDEDGWWT